MARVHVLAQVLAIAAGLSAVSGPVCQADVRHEEWRENAIARGRVFQRFGKFRFGDPSVAAIAATIPMRPE
jgi:hypothetical protein